MAVMLGALYRALLEPNEENARKASEEVASFETKFSNFESKMEKLQGDMNLIKWMLGTLIILVLFLLGKITF
jgi:hypothetical protein